MEDTMAIKRLSAQERERVQFALRQVQRRRRMGLTSGQFSRRRRKKRRA